jgi:hypothetical protein
LTQDYIHDFEVCASFTEAQNKSNQYLESGYVTKSPTGGEGGQSNPLKFNRFLLFPHKHRRCDCESIRSFQIPQ